MKNFRIKEELVFLMLALPSLLGVLIFYLIPFAVSIYLATVDNSVLWNFVGLKNFKDVIANQAFQLGIQNTCVFLAWCVPLNMIFPLSIALLLKNNKNLKNICGIIFLLPLVIPSGSIAFFWQSIFGINGLINGLYFSDSPENWLSSDYAMSIILLIFLWKNIGYNMILFLTALNFIPKEYYECARVEGAGRIRSFFSITLIYLIPTSFLVLIMSLMNSFKSFKEIYLLAGNYPHPSIYMLQHYMNNQFAAANYQRLASASYILSAAIAFVVAFLLYSQNKVAKDF